MPTFVLPAGAIFGDVLITVLFDDVCCVSVEIGNQTLDSQDGGVGVGQNALRVRRVDGIAVAVVVAVAVVAGGVAADVADVAILRCNVFGFAYAENGAQLGFHHDWNNDVPIPLIGPVVAGWNCGHWVAEGVAKASFAVHGL